MGLLFSNHVFPAQKGECARLTGLLREEGGVSCCHRLFPPKTMERRGHVLGSMAEIACIAVAPLPRSPAGSLQLHPHLTTVLVLCFSSTNPTVSLVCLETLLCLRGEKKEPLGQIFLSPVRPPTISVMPCGSAPIRVHCSEPH